MDFVFLHGGGQGSWIWDETIAALHAQAPGDHRTLALDIPGCGTKRDRDTSGIVFPEIVAELLDDIDAAGMGGGGAVLVGHSQAGSVLPAMLARRPQLFARTIYVSCLVPAPGGSVIDTVQGLHARPGAPLHGIFGNPEVTARALFAAMFCNDMGPAQAGAFLDRLEQDRWPVSASVWEEWTLDHLADLPSTYVLCLKDRILPPDAQAVFAARAGCQRIVAIDAGHQVQNTRPHALAEALRLDAAPPA